MIRVLENVVAYHFTVNNKTVFFWVLERWHGQRSCYLPALWLPHRGNTCFRPPLTETFSFLAADSLCFNLGESITSSTVFPPISRSCDVSYFHLTGNQLPVNVIFVNDTLKKLFLLLTCDFTFLWVEKYENE